MGSRLWTALLLLAAVVAGHGAATCVAAAPVSEHGITAPAGLAFGSAVAAVAVDAVGIDTTHHVRAAATRGPGADAAGLAAPWHDVHVVAVCLAALLAGIAALRILTQLRGRALPFGRGSPEPGRWPTGWSRQPAAPDLAVLCLLRI